MAKPQIPQHSIVPLLVQKQLPPMSQSHIHLAIPIDIRRVAIRPRHTVQVKDAALADIDKQADIFLASIWK